MQTLATALGTAIPVAWHVLPANQRGAWMGPLLRLLRWLRPAVPTGVPVLVLADRGLWRPRLWQRLRQLGWHPVVRVRETTRCQPAGQRRRVVARDLVAGPGHAWAGAGVACKDRGQRRAGTLVVAWGVGQRAPWVVLTDLPPERSGVCWYGLRSWIALGCRALKRLGWQWQRTRRTDPTRAARHWRVLAVATWWAVAVGTRVEDADAQGLQGRVWRRLWLAPEPWPAPPPGLTLTLARPP